ncbi:MAG: glycosyltransferase [Caldilineaceae bacterium]
MGEQVWLFVPGSRHTVDDEPNVIRIPGIPIADTGYHLSVTADQRTRAILKQVDVIHVHHPFISGSFGLYYSRRYDLPLVFTNHTRYDLYVQQYLPRLPEAVSETALQAFFQIFSQGCAAMIAPSEGIAGVMREWGITGKIVVVPNGIELEQFHTHTGTVQRADLGIADNAVVGIYVGRMSGEKSVDRLISIFAALIDEAPMLHLLLVGAGPALDEYKELAHTLGIEQAVTFTGAVDYARIADYLALADFFVSASVTEVHPLTFIEAASAGLPAVGIASPGVSEMIEDGCTGYLAKDNDLSMGLRILRLAHDATLRHKLGNEAQAFSKKFAAHVNARRVLELYRTVLTE